MKLSPIAVCRTRTSPAPAPSARGTTSIAVGMRWATALIDDSARPIYSAILGGEHRLIIAAVLFIGGALARDIGWQRHCPGAFEQDLHRLVAHKGEREAATRMPCLGKRADACAKIDHIALAQPFGIADESLPPAQVDPFV